MSQASTVRKRPRQRHRDCSPSGSDEAAEPDLVIGGASSSSSNSSDASFESDSKIPLPSSPLDSYRRYQSIYDTPADSAGNKGKKRALDHDDLYTGEHDQSLTFSKSAASLVPAYHGISHKKRLRFRSPTTPDTTPENRKEITRCKFAKAGCPFQGDPEEVSAHETSYCTPLYTQLAHYKNLARRQKSLPYSPASSDTLLDPGVDAQAQQQQHHDDDGEETDRLRQQVSHLQSDLDKLQSQLEREKRDRTERLRKASERCLQLMSLSELGEGKVEVLRMQLKAERELREKLEEELDAYRRDESSGPSEKPSTARNKRSWPAHGNPRLDDSTP